MKICSYAVKSAVERCVSSYIFNCGVQRMRFKNRTPEPKKLRIGTIYEDVTTDVLGDIGSWQWLVTFVCAALMLPNLFNQYEDMMLLKPNDVYCVPADNIEVVNASLCTYVINNNTEIRCDTWHVKLLWLIWLNKTWLVFCDHKMQVLSTSMICRLGLVFGSIIFGLVADNFGRRSAIVINVFAELILKLVVIFCDSEGWFRLFVFLRSLCGSATLYMGLVIICEIASNRWRSWLSMVVMIPRLVSLVCVVPLANSSPNSETYSFIACLVGAVLIVLIRWTPESPQWLMFNRKISVAEKLLFHAARTNGFKFSGEFKIRPVNHRAYNCLEETTTCLGIITTYNIRVIVLISLLFWSLYYFLWSSIYLRVYSESNRDSLLLKSFCFFGVFGCLTMFSARKLKLRHLLTFNIIVTGAFSVCVIFFKHEPANSLLSSLALASGITAHALILNITPRLFAINVRATIFGCCHATGQLGVVISYLLFLLKAMDDITFATVEIGVTVTLAMLCFLFPDVDGRELPDVMEDMDYFCELSKPLRWATQKTNSPSHEEVEMRVYSFGSAGRVQSSPNQSVERVPAQRIGCTRIWNMFVDCVRRKRFRT